MMARPDEMTGDEARKRKYKDGLVLVLDDETRTSEYEYVTLFGLFYWFSMLFFTDMDGYVMRQVSLL